MGAHVDRKRSTVRCSAILGDSVIPSAARNDTPETRRRRALLLRQAAPLLAQRNDSAALRRLA
jgi:hypothetical protein